MNEELKKLLHDEIKAHHGLISKIAERAKVSQSFVSLVLKGHRENDTVLRIAAQMLREAQAEQRKRQDRLQKEMPKGFL